MKMKLRTLRKAKRMTQRQLAEKCGLDQAMISRIERGIQDVSVRKLLRLARALDVPPADLLGAEDQPDGDKEAA